MPTMQELLANQKLINDKLSGETPVAEIQAKEKEELARAAEAKATEDAKTTQPEASTEQKSNAKAKPRK